jgi:hypothetical protein
MTEIEASGVSFEIDHYEPKELYRALEHTYTNLMWSCRLCNRQKYQEAPTPAMRAAGLRFYRPDCDDPDNHFELMNVTDLRSLSRIGEYSIEVIRLNRQQLKKLRERRHRLYNSKKATLDGIRALRRIGLDRFPAGLRLEIQELIETVGDQLREGAEHTEGIIKQVNRSFNLDPEPKESTKQRRTYLDKIKAFFPGRQ